MPCFNSFEPPIVNHYKVTTYYQPIALHLIILILKLSEYPTRLFYLEFIGTDFLHKVPLVRCIPIRCVPMRLHAHEIHAHEIYTP